MSDAAPQATSRDDLRQALADQSYVLIEYADPMSADPPHVEVLLFSHRAGRPPLASIAPAAQQSAEELAHQARFAITPDTRAKALDLLAYQQEPGTEASASALLRALADPESHVRRQALTTLKDTADRLPFEALRVMARDDDDAAIRTQALELMVERAPDGAAPFLRAALRDPDDAVRERARELADEWHIPL